MADVYKGMDHMLNRYVAIKVLKKEFRDNTEFVEKFHSEAKAAAGLSNPNIVNVYDVGEDRGLNYMVMELVDGITLKEYIRKKQRLSYQEAISIAIQMCHGIGAAHAAEIIHRDIKPQNIMISQDGKVKVTDFGIAKAITSNTITSNAMGSVHYTSPEQARGGFSDIRSDIYSIGITLYEMVTGEVPFDGESTVAVAMKHLQQELPLPSDIVPDLPFSLEQIIIKCTLKNAERRYPQTEALVDDLKHSLRDPEGDFVYIAPVGNADTVMISEEELDGIRHQYDDVGEDGEYDEEEDEYGTLAGANGKGEKVNPKMNKIMKILTIVVAVIILFVLIFVIGRAAGFFNFGPTLKTEDDANATIKVPNVVGMSEADAKEALDKKNLGFKVKERVESDKYEEGIVIEQTPASGQKAKKNSAVSVVVSSGKKEKTIEIPDVAGMSEDEARNALQDAGFTNISSDTQYASSSSVDNGDVISVSPGSGQSVAADTKITLTVSTGEEKVNVPSVVGQSEAAAKSAITGKGLKVAVKTSSSDNTEKGLVMSQSPASGTVSPGSTVTITVSTGPKIEKVTIPTLVGRSLNTARQALENVGLSVGNVEYQDSDTVEAGVVISSSPGGGTSVETGTSVSMVVSNGPADDTDNGADGGSGTTSTNQSTNP